MADCLTVIVVKYLRLSFWELYHICCHLKQMYLLSDAMKASALLKRCGMLPLKTTCTQDQSEQSSVGNSLNEHHLDVYF